MDQALKIEDTAEGFACQTTGLYQDPELCRQMQRSTPDYMKKHFSLYGAWDIIKDDFT